MSFSIQLYLGITTLLLWCQEEITEKIFKMIFSLFISVTIIWTPKIRDSRIHIPFNFLIITISIYIFHKIPWINYQCIKIRSYPRILTAQIGLKSGWKRGPETPLFCYMNNTDTKHKLVEVRSAVQLLQTLLCGSNALNRARNKLWICEKPPLDSYCTLRRLGVGSSRLGEPMTLLAWVSSGPGLVGVVSSGFDLLWPIIWIGLSTEIWA